jgi:hypothetical protein
MTIQIETPEYDPTKKGKPWIARVTFETTTGTLHWGTFIGNSGEAGIVTIDVLPGDIVARGQKVWDNPIEGAATFYRATADATLERFENRKEAWEYWHEQRTVRIPEH